MACEESDCIPSLDVPHAHAAVAVARSCEDVRRIGVPGAALDVAVVADKEAQRRDGRSGPETGGAVGRGGEEVVSQGREADVPDRGGVGAIGDKVSEGIEGPESDCTVCGTGEEVAGMR